MPIFQSPDENRHFDYAVAIYSARHPINARERPIETSPLRPMTDPLVAYMERATEFNSMVFHPDVKAPPGYGTSIVLKRLDAGAPPPGQRGELAPYLLPFYPFLYYAILALWMGALHILGFGPIELFFAARLLSVGMLAGSLVLTWDSARLLLKSPSTCLMITAVAGLMPLTSFVGSYVQPDNLSLLLLSAIFALSLRVRRASAPAVLLIALAAALSLLLITKYQFFLCAGIAVGGLVATRFGIRRLLLLFLPSLATAGVQIWVQAGARQQYISGVYVQERWNAVTLLNAAHAGPFALAEYGVREATLAAFDFYVAGPTILSWWGIFGWMDTPIMFGPRWFTVAIRVVISIGTLVIVGLTSVRLAVVARTLVRRLRRHGLHSGAWLLFSNPVLSTYFIFVGFMFALYVVTGNSFGAQGRDWEPLILPGLLVPLQFAPRGARRVRWRKRLAKGVLMFFVAYAAGGSVAALLSVHARYWGNGRAVNDFTIASAQSSPGSPEFAITYVIPANPRLPSGGSTDVREDEAVSVGGWAVAGRDDPRAVFVAVDNGPWVQAVYGDDETGAPRARSGFDVLIRGTALGPGRHYLNVRVVSSDGRTYRDSDPVSFQVIYGVPPSQERSAWRTG